MLNSAYRSTVHNTSDPEGLNRVQLIIPSVFGPSVVTGWLWPTDTRTTATVPSVGSIVYALFENGDPNNGLYVSPGGGGTAGALLAANNLSDLASAAAARTNLGLGTAATQASSVFLQAANNLSDVTAATARTNLGLGSAALAPRQFWIPADNGLLAAVCDPELVQSSNTITAGVLVMVGMRLPDGGVPATIWYGVSSGGATLTAAQNLVGLYNSSGTLIGTCPDQTTNFGSSGAKSAALTVRAGQSLTVSAGSTVFVGFLFNGTTSPTFMRAGTQNFMVNMNLTAGSFRMANSGSAQTALPTSVTMGSTTSTSGIWAAVA